MLPYPILPFPALRDLLGMVRALYRAELDAGAAPERLAQIAELGRVLRTCLQMSREHPAVLAYASAYTAAERAVKELEGVAGEAQLAPLIAAVARRFSRPRPSFH